MPPRCHAHWRIHGCGERHRPQFRAQAPPTRIPRPICVRPREDPADTAAGVVDEGRIDVMIAERLQGHRTAPRNGMARMAGCAHGALRYGSEGVPVRIRAEAQVLEPSAEGMLWPASRARLRWKRSWRTRYLAGQRLRSGRRTARPRWRRYTWSTSRQRRRTRQCRLPLPWPTVNLSECMR